MILISILIILFGYASIGSFFINQMTDEIDRIPLFELTNFLCLITGGLIPIFPIYHLLPEMNLFLIILLHIAGLNLVSKPITQLLCLFWPVEKGHPLSIKLSEKSIGRYHTQILQKIGRFHVFSIIVTTILFIIFVYY